MTRVLIACSDGLIKRYRWMVFWLSYAVGNTMRSLVLGVSVKKKLRNAVLPEQRENNCYLLG